MVHVFASYSIQNFRTGALKVSNVSRFRCWQHYGPLHASLLLLIENGGAGLYRDADVWRERVWADTLCYLLTVRTRNSRFEIIASNTQNTTYYTVLRQDILSFNYPMAFAKFGFAGMRRGWWKGEDAGDRSRRLPTATCMHHIQLDLLIAIYYYIFILKPLALATQSQFTVSHFFTLVGFLYSRRRHT